MKYLTPNNPWSKTDVVKGLIALGETLDIAESSRADWWGGLVSASMENNVYIAQEEGKDVLKNFWATFIEDDYKAEAGVSKMPGAYRSAKTVINKALAAGVELLDSDGNPRGKSEIEKETREAQPEKSNVDKLLTCLTTVSNLLDKAKDEGEDLAQVRGLLADLYTKAS